MTKGQQIAYAIKKTVSEYSFMEWLEIWDISKAEWDKFMNAGILAIDKDGENHEHDFGRGKRKDI